MVISGGSLFSTNSTVDPVQLSPNLASHFYSHKIERNSTTLNDTLSKSLGQTLKNAHTIQYQQLKGSSYLRADPNSVAVVTKSVAGSSEIN